MKKGKLKKEYSQESVAQSDELFEKEIKKLKFFYKSNKEHNKEILKERLLFISKRNKDLEPSIDMNYFCATCGSRDGKENPNTAYCFHCDTDNWESQKTNIDT